LERLHKLIAQRGYCSRRKAEELIQAGCVKVNGEIVTKLGTKVKKTATIEIKGNQLPIAIKRYFLFYKPLGVLSTTTDDRGRPTILDYFGNEKGLYPVGRLDYNTTGLIIVTNDGTLANLIMHPREQIEKVYVATVNSIVMPQNIKAMADGIIIDNKKAAKAKVKVRRINRRNNKSVVQVTIGEGRYHQIKKMFAYFGYEVLKLKRERIAFLDLKGLKPGEYRPLTIKEVRKLYNLVSNHK
jgi:23S rRNA pseudouridine2605 synthase